MTNNQQTDDLILPPPVEEPGAAIPSPKSQISGTQAPIINSNQTVVPQPVSANPALADDSDLIEKEWVNKAKEIVNQTKDDPLKQSQAISHLKADYMKKRYNKDIKLEKGQ